MWSTTVNTQYFMQASADFVGDALDMSSLQAVEQF
jgi:hypothetical protein